MLPVANVQEPMWGRTDSGRNLALYRLPSIVAMFAESLKIDEIIESTNEYTRTKAGNAF